MPIATTTALAIASTGVAAAGAYSQAKAQKASAAYSKQVALNNEVIAKQNARDVELRGRQAIFDQRRAVARQLGNVRAATAGSGLVVNEAGTTPQDLVKAMTIAGELDVMRLRNNVENEKRRALVQAANFKAEAGAFELQRQSINPLMSAAISGVGSLNANSDILFPGKAT